jgi:arylformamidase
MSADNSKSRRRIATRVSRRTILNAAGATAATTAAMASMPALADSCQFGPPPHQKGPLVWMDMDQVELDAAYDQSFYAPTRQAIARFISDSELTLQRLGPPRREAYGPTEIEKIDIYQTKRPHAPIFVFIHGGAWLGGPAKNRAFIAEMFLNAGAHFVSPDFVRADGANGDLRVMADQVRRAIAWTYKNAASFNGDPDRLYIGGHSSGGHLSAVALVTDWKNDFGVPETIVKSGLCMSGMYDMKAVRLSKRNSYVKFTDDMEQAMSPQRHIDQLRVPLIVTYGSYETPEFQRQARDFAAAVKAAGKPVELIEAANYSHVDMEQSLGNPYSHNGRAALAMMKLAPA